MDEKEIKSRFLVKETLFHGQTTLEIDKNDIFVCLEAFKVIYPVLIDLTAVDYISPVKRTKIVYWLHNPENYMRLRIVCYVGRDETISSVTSIWAGANWYEREIFDLFGVQFTGHPDLKRIMLPDEWEGHPLRRDHALVEESVEFLHSVKPKAPSAIIPTTYPQSRSHANNH